jgi:hypothetical protein
VDIEKLTSLIKKREELCFIQNKLYHDDHTIQLVWELGVYEPTYKLEAELARELKSQAKEYYHDEIAFVTQEIEKLMQGEKQECLKEQN